MRKGQAEFQEDFFIPIPLDTNNITALSPFLVPQDHLGHHGVYMAMAAFTFFLFIGGTAINLLTIMCTIQFKKLRSHLNYILVNLSIANLLVSFFGSSLACYSFFNKYFIFGSTGCKIEGFASTLGGIMSQHYSECFCVSLFSLFRFIDETFRTQIIRDDFMLCFICFGRNGESVVSFCGCV